jgi:hypothetical protein
MTLVQGTFLIERDREHYLPLQALWQLGADPADGRQSGPGGIPDTVSLVAVTRKRAYTMEASSVGGREAEYELGEQDRCLVLPYR